MAGTRKYKDHLNERLQDLSEAIGYLNAALEDEDPRVFLLALRDVADARGGLGWLAKKGDFSRESLYRTLSKRGNPRLNNLKSILEVMGIHLSLHSEEECRHPRRTHRRGRRPRA